MMRPAGGGTNPRDKPFFPHFFSVKEEPKKASESVEKEEVNFGEGWKASPPLGNHIQRGFSAQA